MQSFIDDNGHYHYIDIDRLEADGNESGDQAAARAPGYEGLDQSDVPAQPQRPHDYDRIGAGDNAATAQQTAEQIEMNVLDDDYNYQDAVSPYYQPTILTVHTT